MKILKLKIRDRLGIARLLNELYAAKGLDLQGVKIAGDIVDKIVLSDKDREDVGWKVDGAQVVWDMKKDKGQDVELNSDQEKMLKEIIETKSKNKDLGVGDIYLIGLAQQLGVIKEDEK